MTKYLAGYTINKGILGLNKIRLSDEVRTGKHIELNNGVYYIISRGDSISEYYQSVFVFIKPGCLLGYWYAC